MMTIGVAIVGGTGYGAGELLRLLACHPCADVVGVTSRSSPGKAISDAHPHLRGFYDGRFVESVDFDALRRYRCRFVVSALPNGASCKVVEEIGDMCKETGTMLIDLSGDFRLKDPDQHSRHYPESAAGTALRGSFVYGLPEVNREEIKDAQFVANPGCLATACILSVAPLQHKGHIIFDAKTGSSGGGRTLRETTHHPVRHSNYFAYKPLAHQHEPEIVQALGGGITCSFVPQSAPMSRGIYVTSYLDSAETGLKERFEEFYAEAPFVRVCSSPPEIENVIGSNFCDVAVFQRGSQVVCMAALDNLVKGMSGQAIQNMNILCGLPDTTGLWHPALRPV
jgi:LysW-gamma-L-alpha-aminoadipyl-6-phosphate/LysW-L-glutamyl-5-phosphate reductase